MKVLMINVVSGIRSTGRICKDLAVALEKQGHEVKIAYGRGNVPEQLKKYAVKIGTEFDIELHGLRARFIDGAGFGSRRATEKFIKWVKEYDPDVIHMHNIHGYYVNVETLFKYLKTCGKKIIWTLHDCWAFTGHTAYCDAIDCRKWEEGCHHCPQIGEYPKAYIDRSRRNWQKKKELFTGIPNMTIVSPSKWLAGLVKDSFLQKYPIQVIHNGIDTKQFYPMKSSFREAHGLQDKYIVLGVAAVWDKRKGLEDIVKLSRMLDNNYQIIVVGVTEWQKVRLPENVIGITRTDSIRELAELYSSADVFVNPTYEDNYPTTNLEAIACGTPVITYDTGGSGESAKIFGKVIKKDVTEILRSIQQKDFRKMSEMCLDSQTTVNKYMGIYK